ncbi:MAG: phosphoribosylglycinamide formyltransferase [Bacteroidota bacterium]|nr:phosphoribosylglycinamide formyltransferase [Bacteroidota bacterium]
MKRVAIFASGNGTNSEAIINHFKNSNKINISAVFSNNANAFVLQRARRHGIATKIFDREDFYNSNKVMSQLKEMEIDFIILAGFMWLIPQYLITQYSSKIINIHPALLPNYGGKGMYGDRVHKKIIENGEKTSGITIHFVNNKYDDGQIIFQTKCNIDDSDTPETLAEKIHKLEHQHYPTVIESTILKTFSANSAL